MYNKNRSVACVLSSEDGNGTESCQLLCPAQYTRISIDQSFSPLLHLSFLPQLYLRECLLIIRLCTVRVPTILPQLNWRDGSFDYSRRNFPALSCVIMYCARDVLIYIGYYS
jgi:hypothetical protein